MKLATVLLSLLTAITFGFVVPAPSTTAAGVRTAFPITVVDDLHNHVRIAHLPKRIVSLDPRDTETLFALGLEKRVVADGGAAVEGAAGITQPFRYPSQWPSKWGRDYPTRSRTLPHVEGGCCGTPWNLETVESLHPDLILALNSDLPTVQKMRDLGLKVLVLDPSNIPGILHDVQLVGKATGATTRAAAVVKQMNTDLKAVSSLAARARSRPRLYYEIDATNPTEPYTAGPHTFIDDAIRRAGGTNVADGVKGCSGTTCYPQISLESLVRLDPQIILLGDAAYGTTVSSLTGRPGWSGMSAVTKGKVYPFNDELVSRAGPRIAIGLQKMQRLVHPELFKKR